MLKSLELVGFKSFAERTRLEFPRGVTVVVGPNGSGKSNVVDAIKWVLGSQSPRSLRGAEMTDVIFNGAESRGPLNLAEVTLAFDNAPGGMSGRRLFDLDEEEVRLTRRVHRSGEGEYLVNGRACRLKDFRELLAGTGVGAESYSIIEQGRVDAALRASPLERRLLLEEAAGVSRFRLKKREASKRLERVEQNLLRLSDIVDEVEGRLRRVRAQAGKARRYREASLRLKEARTELAAAEHQQLAAERSRLGAEHKALAERAAEAQAEVAQLEQRLAALQQGSGDDARAERLVAEARRRLSRAERDGAVARSESGRLADRQKALEAELVGVWREALDAPADNPAQAALVAARQTAADYVAALAGSESRLAGIASRRSSALLRREATHRDRDRVGGVLARAGDLAASLVRRRDAAVAALGELEAHQAPGASLSDESHAGVEEAVAQRDAATQRLQAIDTAVTQTQIELTQQRRTLTEAQRSLAGARERLVGLRHRHETIAQEQRRLERLGSDVESLVGRSADAPLGPFEVGGLVADLIHVEEDFVGLVEAALGARAEHVVVDSRRSLWRALTADGALDALTTRAGFQPLDASPPATALDQVDLRGEPGVLGHAADFVEVEPRYAPLVRRLFARCWFVNSLATATKLAESVGRGLTFVTLGGETLGADGTLVCGPTGAAVRVLTRREDGAALAAQIDSGERSAQSAEATAAAAEQAIGLLEQRLVGFQGEANGWREKLASAAQKAAALEERRRQAQLATERTAAQRRQRHAESAALAARLATLTQRTARLEARRVAVTEPAAEADAEVRALESEAAGEAARRAELAAAAARHGELLASLAREARQAPEAEGGLVQRASELESEIATAQRGAEAADLRTLAASSVVASEALVVCRCEAELAQSRAARRAGEQIRSEVVAALAQARVEAETHHRRGGEIDLQRQRAELEARGLAQRVRDDYGVDVAALPTSDAPLAAPQRQALREEIERLRAELQSIGPVSIESLEELDELETRFAKLSSQYQDLSQAKQSLARLTARIDSDSRELFQATYEAVREQFRELFARLFGGGEADLVLVDSPASADGEALEGGVEVVACPPGKELRSLSLLSGGEKTMTCVALLLALFRSRPSPFCVLDEVDAALDEANVGRFTAVLKDFLGATQFVVITHSKRTMSGADTLYGITMQESGVSKQVSVRFEDVAEDGRIVLRRPGTEAGRPPAGGLPALRAA